VYLHVLYGSQNTETAFPYTSLNQVVFVTETYSILCDVGSEVSYKISINIRSVKIVLNNRYIEELSSQLTGIPAFAFKDQ
jgi:hypothetical protein